MPVALVPLITLIPRGELREQTLAAFRESLREIPDPETGQPYGEDVIRLSTMVGSHRWVEAEGDDIFLQSAQSRAEYLAQNIDPRRSSTNYLEGFHGEEAKLPRLLADGGSGEVKVVAPPGTVFLGSSQVGLDLCTRAQVGNLYFAVLFNATTPADGNVRVILKGIDGGGATNLLAGTKVAWINQPGADIGEVVDDFGGGADTETDQEWGDRLFDAKGSRAKAGNAAHIRIWARDSSSAVHRAYVYESGLGSGTVVVVVLQKRSRRPGPYARVPSIGLMTTVKNYLTPPASAVVPGQARVVVVPGRPQLSDGVLRLGLKSGGPAGWADIDPWPRFVTEAARVMPTPAPTRTAFTIRADTTLPPAGTPQLMIWNVETSAFEKLAVSTIAMQEPGLFVVTLATPHSRDIVTGDRISPYASRHGSISKGIVAYFDSLGAGEIVASDDRRFALVARRPFSSEQEPASAGERVISFISQAIGGTIERGEVEAFSPNVPPVPTFSASHGTYFLVPGNIAIYPAD